MRNWPGLSMGMHIVTFFSISIPTPIPHSDIGLSVTDRSISLVRIQPLNLIAPREAVLSWKAETCDPKHHLSCTITACAVMMHSGYNNGDLLAPRSLSGQCSLAKCLHFVGTYCSFTVKMICIVQMLVLIRISFWVHQFNTSNLIWVH